ncbi:MAG: YigZ family protein [Oscillospiraceae bacterium]|nr:YigZ family protein [Oscillospiraceae bacterium]
MIKPYKLPLRAAQAEFTEKKSRFIGHISPVSSEEEALSFLRAIRARHREASHNVYAYRLKDGGICRHSDDGEPSGTAGMPLLEGFLKQDIFDFCCVATRYYGGIMLGAGGLVRAYARCGTAALEASGVGVMREMTLCAAAVPYPLYETVKRLLMAGGAEIRSEDFGVDVRLRFAVISDNVPALRASLTELTAGTVGVSTEGTQLSASP